MLIAERTSLRPVYRAARRFIVFNFNGRSARLFQCPIVGCAEIACAHRSCVRVVSGAVLVTVGALVVRSTGSGWVISAGTVSMISTRVGESCVRSVRPVVALIVRTVRVAVSVMAGAEVVMTGILVMTAGIGISAMIMVAHAESALGTMRDIRTWVVVRAPSP